MQNIQSSSLSTERQSNQQKQMRQAFQQLYKQKLIQIKRFYEKQNESLKQTIQSVYKRILTDQLLVTMIGDKTTSTYIQQRVEELFAQIVSNQRQIIIEKLGIQMNQAKFYHNETVKKYQKLKNEFDSHVSASIKQKLVYQQKKSELNQQLRKHNQESYKQSLKIKSLQSQIDEKASIQKSLTMENQLLNQELQKVDKHMENAIVQSNVRFNQKTFQISSYKQLAKNLQKKLEETQNNFKKIKEGLEKKHQLKINQYKLKIEEYKLKMTQLLQQSGKNLNPNFKLSKTQYQNNIQKQWEIKMGNILMDHQKDIQDLKSLHLIQKNQGERLFQNKVKQIQNHYQKQLQKKMKEVNQEASQYWKQVKSKESSIKETIQNYQENFIAKQEHLNLLKQREDLIISMKDKIDQDELQIQEKCGIINQMQKMIGHLKSQNQLLNKKDNQNREVIAQLKSKLKMYDQTLNAIKGSQKKLRTQLQTAKTQIQRLEKSYQQSKRKNSEIVQIVQQKSTDLKERDKKIKQLGTLTQELQRKIKDLQAQLQISSRNSTDIQNKLQQAKQQISNLQYKCKQIEHKYLLESNQLDYKNKKLSEDLISKTQQVQQWQKKYKTIQQQFICIKSTHNETDTLNQKLELQIRHCRQTQGNAKIDYEAQIGELKSKILDKSGQLVKLKKQYQIQILQIKEQSEVTTLKFKQLSQKLKINKGLVANLNKFFRKNYDSMRKQLDGIVNYCKNISSLMSNQIKINYRLLQNQITQCHRSSSYIKSQNVLQLKEQFSLQRQKLFSQFRTSQAIKQKSYQQRLNNVEIVYKQQVSQRQIKLNQCIEKIKHFQGLLYNSKEEILKLNRQIQCIHKKRQKQAQQHIKIVHSLKSQYQNDANSLIAQYQQKANLSHQEIQQLILQIQKIKIQTDSLKSQHNQEKNGLSTQLRTVQEQQQQILSVIAKKDSQLQKMHEQLQRIAQNRNHLESQLRQVWQQNQQNILRLQEMGYNNQQLSQSLELSKSKIDRLQEQNIQLQTQIKQKSTHQQQILKSKTKAELQLRELRQAIDRNDKFRDIRALQQMTLQTQELTNKVNQMKKMGEYLQNQNKRCLRS